MPAASPFLLNRSLDGTSMQVNSVDSYSIIVSGWLPGERHFCPIIMTTSVPICSVIQYRCVPYGLAYHSWFWASYPPTHTWCVYFKIRLKFTAHFLTTYFLFMYVASCVFELYIISEECDSRKWSLAKMHSIVCFLQNYGSWNTPVNAYFGPLKV